ncbi:hypothetical protein BGZ68_005421 [Mortierella alpina]|nr:hypothetical protein BGZ68_005421 [Mortierella alpina]
MIVTTVAVCVFIYLKNGIALSRKRNRHVIALCLSSFGAALFLFYAGHLIALAQREDTVIPFLIAGFDVAIAFMLIVDGVLTELHSAHLSAKRATSSINGSATEDSYGNTHATARTPQEPLPVHLYQPRLSFTPNERISGTTAPIGDVDTETAQQQQQDNDALELEELPKYERRRPAQHATIVDMANLASTDATVLRSADILVPSREVTHHQGNDLEQGQELRLEMGDALSTVDAPEYSPSLVEAPPPPPAETLVSCTSPATTNSSPSTQRMSSTGSPTAAPTDAPFITVTSAPPVYAP